MGVKVKRQSVTLGTIRVCNAVNTSKYKPIGHDDWISFWKENCKEASSSVGCQNPTCNNKDVVGAHVITLDEHSPQVYLVPLCEGCNNKREGLGIIDVDRDMCCPAPDQCLYLEDEDSDPQEINDANKRILDDNEENLKDRRQELCDAIAQKAVRRHKSILQYIIDRLGKK